MKLISEGLERARELGDDESLVPLVSVGLELERMQNEFGAGGNPVPGEAQHMAQQGIDFLNKIYGRRFRRAATVEEVLESLAEMVEMDIENWDFLGASEIVEKSREFLALLAEAS